MSESQFALASSVCPVRLPERRRRVISTLKQFGLVNVKPDRKVFTAVSSEAEISLSMSTLDVGSRNSATQFRFRNSSPSTR